MLAHIQNFKFPIMNKHTRQIAGKKTPLISINKIGLYVSIPFLFLILFFDTDSVHWN